MTTKCRVFLVGAAALVLWRPVCWVLAMLWLAACEVPFIGGRR